LKYHMLLSMLSSSCNVEFSNTFFPV
jgi:hypothetical protein